MDLSRLEKNLTDNIKEAQLKLGYEHRPMSLNYMLSSLNHLLGTAFDSGKMETALLEFSRFSAERLGGVTFRPIKDGFCLTVPAEGTEYVNSRPEENGFLSEFVSTVAKHGISVEEVFAVFRKYSADAVIKETGFGEFDYLAYFPDGVPDDYRYCLTAEPCLGGGVHVIYHRFIPEDYEDFDFSAE